MGYLRWTLSSLLLLATLPVRAALPLPIGFYKTTSAATYLVNQGFEGAGYDNGETWTEAVGDPDENFSSTGLGMVGDQVLQLATTINERSQTDFTAQSDMWAFCLFRVDTDQSGATPQFIFYFTDNAGANFAGMRVEGDRQVYLYANGSDSSASATTLSIDTTYYVWLHYVSGGTCTLHMSTSSTRPSSDGSGNVYLEKTAASVNLSRINCRTTDGTLLFDHVLVDDAEIGNNP